MVVCVPPETFNLLERGTAETCAVRPPTSIAVACISAADEIPLRLMYPKFCGTPFVRLELLADGVLRLEWLGDEVLSLRLDVGLAA